MNPNESPPSEFEGECAFAVGLGKHGVAGKANWHAVHDGKHYVFSNPVARFLWRVLPGRKEAAEHRWAERQRGSGHAG